MKVRSRLYLPAVMMAAAVLMASCAGGVAGSRGELHVWDTGTSVTYVSSSVEATTMEIPGAGEQATSSTSSMTFDVEATGPRTFKVAITDASQSADMDIPEGMMPDVSELIGLVSSVALDSRGKVAEASNIEDNPFIDSRGGVENFKEMTLQSLFLYLPEGDMKPGVEWSRELDFPATMMGMITVNFSIADEYKCLEMTTYEGVPVYKIANTGSGGVSGGGDVQGTPVDFAVTGLGEGTYYISVDTGMIIMSEVKIRMSGGIAAEGMDIPISILGTTTLKLKK